MNQLSLQVVTWGTVASTVSTAFWLALAGDAARVGTYQVSTPPAVQSVTQVRGEPSPAMRPTQPVVYEPKVQPRSVDRAPVTLLGPPRPRARTDG